MSRKNRKNRGLFQGSQQVSQQGSLQGSQPQPQSQPATVSNELAAEYVVIKHDLIRVVVLNMLMLAAVLALYYTNLHSQYLERWAEKLFHF